MPSIKIQTGFLIGIVVCLLSANLVSAGSLSAVEILDALGGSGLTSGGVLDALGGSGLTSGGGDGGGVKGLFRKMGEMLNSGGSLGDVVTQILYGVMGMVNEVNKAIKNSDYSTVVGKSVAALLSGR